MNFTLDFFEALRRMKTRKTASLAPFSPENSRFVEQVEERDSAHTNSLRIGSAGLALIKQFEGCEKRRSDGRFEAYPDPGTGGDPWTIGWGATGKGITRNTIWTQAECDDRLQRDLVRFAREVSHAIGDAPTSQNQFDALVSFHYNTGAIAKATLTKLHKRGEFDAAKAEFGKWVHAGGRRLNGLVRRREAEASLYAGG